MKPARWTAREMEMLEQMAGDQPPDRLIRSYNNWAKRQGFTARTHGAILTRLSRAGISARAEGDWVSSGYVCATLGIGIDTTQRWTDHRGIPHHRGGRNARFFRRSDLRRVAREQPETFGGISADRLFLLLEDRELADSIAARFPRRAMEPRPVRAVETGWSYPSVRAAAARFNICRQAIQHAIRTGGTAAGLHWTHA